MILEQNLDLGVRAQVIDDALQRLLGQLLADLVFHLGELGRRLVAHVLDQDDVISELRLHRLGAVFAGGQRKSGNLELLDHLPGGEITQISALSG